MKKKIVNDTEVMEPVDNKWQTTVREDDRDDPMVSYEFDDLEELASYQVKVRCRNSLGWSEWSPLFDFSTSHGQHNLTSLVLSK